MKRIFVIAAIAVSLVAVAGCSGRSADANLVKVPSLYGMSESDAKATAKAHHLKFEYDTDDILTASTSIPEIAVDVKSQSPKAGKEVKKGTILHASLELAQLTVPDEVGSACSDAVTDLTANGFTSTSSCADGAIVKSQNPAAGAIATGLSEVSLISTVPMVVYSVSGNGGYSNVITFTKPGTVDIEQASNARLPWHASFPEPGPDAIDNFESISAQDENGTSISCTITDNGVVVDHETATGRYAIVECSSS